MPNAAIHPPPQQLTAFAQGKLTDSEAAAIACHLETCLACRQAIEKVPADSFVGKLRAARPSVSALPARTGDAPKRPAIAAASSPPPKGLPPDLANYSKYRFVRELGRGGMGVVYQAEQTVMGRNVAVKVINPSVLDHPDALPRFQSEVRAAAKLDHPNIVRAFDADQVGNIHLLVMEYVEGTSLAELVAKKGPLPVPYACHFIRQAALGLQHAFEQGMVHRDIKPQNLMVNARGQIKVLDFGLARMRSERKAGGGLTAADAFMGTPEYVSPEQATDARSADARADIYSLGCTLFFLLTGRPPFQEDTIVKQILAQIEKEPPALHEVRAEVPAELSAVVARMLAKDPARRFQTPVEVAQALAAFVKPGTKPATAGAPSPSSGVSSPGMGTMIAADTSKIKAILGDMPRKVLAKESPAKDAAASAFAGLGEEVTSAKKKAKPARKAAKPVRRAAWYRRWPVLAGASVLLLALLGMWVAGVFKRDDSRAVGLAPIQVPLEPVKVAVVTNSLGMRFAWCPPGTFQMGSPRGEEGRDDDETQHKVTLSKGFYLGVHEVTQAQWRAVMPTNTSPSKFKGDNLPVEQVTWQECQEFCTKLGQMDGKRYRLPTEAEWEYACRAGTKTAYFFGDDPKQLGDYAWSNANADGKTHEVGTRKPNAWGLFDMHGNVWEWCQDWYGPYPDQDIKDPQSNINGEARVLRGGSWYIFPGWCRSAIRRWIAPGNRYGIAGCRVVLCQD